MRKVGGPNVTKLLDTHMASLTQLMDENKPLSSGDPFVPFRWILGKRHPFTRTKSLKLIPSSSSPPFVAITAYLTATPEVQQMKTARVEKYVHNLVPQHVDILTGRDPSNRQTLLRQTSQHIPHSSHTP